MESRRLRFATRVFQALLMFTLLTATAFAAPQGVPPPELPGWIGYRSPHFTLYFAPDSKYLKDAKARKGIIDKLEAQLSLVCKELSRPKPNLVKYYYFDRWDDGKKWGVKMGTANLGSMSVYHVHACMHELVHIVAAGIKKNVYRQYTGSYRMLDEGLADWIGLGEWAKIGCRQVDHFKVTRDMQTARTLPTIPQMWTEFLNRSRRDYTPAASFCGYLIQHYGMKRFLQTFSSGSRPEDFQRSYGKTIQQIEWDWHNFLASYRAPGEPRIVSAVPPNGAAGLGEKPRVGPR